MAEVDSKQSWFVACVVLVIMGFAYGAAWITTVALTEIAKEVGGSRAIPALATSFAFLGSGLGGMLMGRVSRRLGARGTVISGALMIAAGLSVSTLGVPAPLLIGHAVLIGLIGLGLINAPMYIYTSQWFLKRRGSALALISSGLYLAGTVWPPIFDFSISRVGWRQTMLMFGLLVLAVIVPLAIFFLRQAPEAVQGSGGAPLPQRFAFRIAPNLAFTVLCFAAVFCCVPMAMPQQHMIAFCGDLGISRAIGAGLLSVLLGAAFVSRQLWGLVSDQIGGLKTILISSGIQVTAFTGFLFTQSEAGLFLVAGAFGAGLSAIIPSYALVIRELFTSEDAYWRIPIVLFCTASGMALGGWLAGLMYDYFGSYAPAFAAGIVSNLLNFAGIAFLVRHQAEPQPTQR